MLLDLLLCLHLQVLSSLPLTDSWADPLIVSESDGLLCFEEKVGQSCFRQPFGLLRVFRLQQSLLV